MAAVTSVKTMMHSTGCLRVSLVTAKAFISSVSATSPAVFIQDK